MQPKSPSQGDVDARWKNPGSGEHYVSDRWRGSRARERDPRLVKRLLRTLPASAQMEACLDVPCGTGRLAGTVDAPLFVQSDISMSMLGNIPTEAARGCPVQSSASALPFASDSFDLVLCCRLLHHLTDSAVRQAVIQEIVRVSKDHVIASYWDAATYGAWRRRTSSPLRRRKRPDVRQAVSFEVLCAEFQAAGARVLRRAHSLRFVSQQTFLLAKKK
ncbi:MAG: ubiquinone/menaquinone biosynthesis C-methylase UbiE [Planctomycetota bacterium]|jgi:ubiquinone/menaquinone biosynthesis C-methylase UbiE